MAEGLLGFYERSLDDKNRLVLPPEIRNRLDSQVVISRWYDRSLALFGEKEYAEFGQLLHRQGSYEGPIRSARREVFGGASPISVDSQGRMTLPERLLKGFLLDEQKDRDLVLLGDWNKVILYSSLRFGEIAEKDRVNLDEALAQVERSAREISAGAGADPDKMVD